jgi:hypothetical protein
MTGAAWVMLIVTWSVITFFTAKFFIKVVRTPPRQEDGGLEGAAEVDDISEHD